MITQLLRVYILIFSSRPIIFDSTHSITVYSSIRKWSNIHLYESKGN